jgi:4-hydroxy-4-methyl-2-oxoglutarate aldolase
MTSDGVADIFIRLRNLSTCQVSDGLRVTGNRPFGLVGITSMLSPAPKVVGRAMTVQFGPIESVTGPRLEYLEHVEPGEVIVIANSGRLDASAWGGQRSIGATQCGAAATVIDGAYRDLDECISIGYPVYGRGVTVAGSRSGGTCAVAVNEQISVAGTDVVPGDYIVADSSGVIVVPQGDVLAALDAAERVAAMEQQVTDAVQAGSDFVSYRKSLRESAGYS